MFTYIVLADKNSLHLGTKEELVLSYQHLSLCLYVVWLTLLHAQGGSLSDVPAGM